MRASDTSLVVLSPRLMKAGDDGLCLRLSAATHCRRVSIAGLLLAIDVGIQISFVAAQFAEFGLHHR